MKTSYVDITRNDFEEWLNTLPFEWSLAEGKFGIYWVHLSEFVAVRISSTMTSKNETVSYANASVQMDLISRVTGKSINSKAKDRKHFKRTLGWRKTWREGVEHWVEVYRSASEFYDKVGSIPDRLKYSQHWIRQIEEISQWSQSYTLRYFHENLSKGKVLTDSQEQSILLWRRYSRPPTEETLEIFRDLYKKACADGDLTVKGFLAFAIPFWKEGNLLSLDHIQRLESSLEKYHMQSWF